MSQVLSVLAFLLLLVGVFFIVTAVIGILRFADPLQRMHASTKTGTVGAGLAILGTVLEMRQLDVTFVGLGAFFFLLLTVPIAGHLLGRATYLSGARLDGLKGDDALKGVLERNPITLDEVLDRSRAPESELAPQELSPRETGLRGKRQDR